MDYPNVSFVQAAGYNVGRSGQPIKWLVIHTTESNATPAQDAHYAATRTDDHKTSAHLYIGSHDAVQGVRVGDTAWATGSWLGNHSGLQYELEAHAGWTEADWSSAHTLIERTAALAALDCKRFGIPAVLLGVADVKAGRRGITSHLVVREALGGSTHTDPGPNFPWARLLGEIQAGPHTYTIQAGDTLSSIAAHLGLMGATYLYSLNSATIEGAARAHGQHDSNHGALIYPGVVLHY